MIILKNRDYTEETEDILSDSSKDRLLNEYLFKSILRLEYKVNMF